jgi:ABC-type proline/glycine betaine transport system substrate-binding protein
MQLPIEDINAQNMRMRQGESSEADVGRHVDGWIKAHQQTFDGWLEQARRCQISIKTAPALGKALELSKVL